MTCSYAGQGQWFCSVENTVLYQSRVEQAESEVTKVRFVAWQPPVFYLLHCVFFFLTLTLVRSGGFSFLLAPILFPHASSLSSTVPLSEQSLFQITLKNPFFFFPLAFNFLLFGAFQLNLGTVGFYRTQYSPDMLESLIPAIKDLSLPPVDRLGLQNDLFSLVSKLCCSV